MFLNCPVLVTEIRVLPGGSALGGAKAINSETYGHRRGRKGAIPYSLEGARRNGSLLRANPDA